MIAAGKQNRGFNFAQLLYFNQGPENGGWLDDTMVAYAAEEHPGRQRRSSCSKRRRARMPWQTQAKTYDAPGQADGLAGTPTLLLGKSGGKLTALVRRRARPSTELSAAIDRR